MSDIRCRVGKGDILFWLDTNGAKPLASQFTKLYRCTTDHFAAVSSYMTGIADQIVWEPIFRRNLTEIEGDSQEMLPF